MTLRLLCLIFCQLTGWLAGRRPRTPRSSCSDTRWWCCAAGHPAMPLLARPRRALGADPAAPQAAPTPSVSDAGDVAALASAAAQAASDQTPPPARSTGDPHAATAVDPSDGSREPDLGLPAHPRRTHPARLQARAKYRVATPQPSRHRSGAAPCGADLAAAPVRPGQGDPGLRSASTSTACCSSACRCCSCWSLPPAGCTSSA